MKRNKEETDNNVKINTSYVYKYDELSSSMKKKNIIGDEI